MKEEAVGAYVGLVLVLGALYWTVVWTIDGLRWVSADLNKWAANRHHYEQLGTWVTLAWIVISILVVRWLRRSGRKSWPRWDYPGRIRGLDKIMRKALLGDRYKGGTFLGVAAGKWPVVLPTWAREGHMQIVGPTRSGKSQLLMAICAQDMRRSMPVFFMEAKGDRGDFSQFLKAAQAAGRLDAVRYFNPQDPGSMTFNPIRPVPGQDATAVANQLSRAIGREPSSSGEGRDYYASVDFAKIQSMAEVFCATNKQFTLKDCFYYFSFKRAREKVFDLCPDRKLVAFAYRGFDQHQDTSALTSALRPWTTGHLGALLNSYSPQIRLEDVFAKDQLAYFAIPIGHLQVLANSLGRMVIAGLLSVAASRQKLAVKPAPACVVLDEFSEFATPSFASFIATVGSAKLWTILSHQDLGQLKKIQGMDADAFSSAIFNNTSGCKVGFRTPDPEDAEFWASTIGTFRTFVDTQRIDDGILFETHTGQKSRREVEEFKIHPNKLKNLSPGTAFIFSPGLEECLAYTASVFWVLTGPTPPVPVVAAAQDEGLDLEAAVGGSESVEPVDQKRLVKA